MPDPHEQSEQKNNSIENRAEKAEFHAEKGLRSDVTSDDLQSHVENKTKEARLLKELREDGLRTHTHSVFGTPEIPGVIEGGAPSPATINQQQLRELQEGSEKGMLVGAGGKFVPAGTPLEIKGKQYPLEQLTAQGAELQSDASSLSYEDLLLTRSPTEWNAELSNFSKNLEDKIGHSPKQADYAEVMQNPESNFTDVIDATLLYAYGIRDRQTDKGAFAENAIEDMLERAKAWKLLPLEPKQIDANAIHQNYPDSCPFMATVIGLANTAEGRVNLSAMIQPKEDGTYQVYFPGDTGDPVSVGGLTKGEKMLGASSDQGYIFPAILEKAYGERLNANQPDGNRLPISSDACRLGFEDYKEPLRLLTGDDVISIGTRRSLNPEVFTGEQKFRDLLTTAKHDGAIAIAGIKGAPEDAAVKNMGIHKYHAYLVTGFDNNGITLLDPLPGSKAEREKVLTWKQFNDSFNELMIQQKKSKK